MRRVRREMNWFQTVLARESDPEWVTEERELREALGLEEGFFLDPRPRTQQSPPST